MFHKSESVFVNIYIHSRGKDTEKYNFLTQSDKIKFIESIHTKMVCNMLMQDVILSKRCCPLFDPFLDGVFICIPDVHYLVWPSTNTKSLDILFQLEDEFDVFVLITCVFSWNRSSPLFKLFPKSTIKRLVLKNDWEQNALTLGVFVKFQTQNNRI